jgi:hypothetical protein
VDPDAGIFVILLTNRVNPTRERFGIGPVRAAVADAALGALRSAAGDRASLSSSAASLP